MGLLCSKEDTSGDEYAPALPTVEKRQKVPKEELNIDDFIIENRENEVIVRAPGTLNQQFCIENCRGCTFYLLDITDCISIDDCDDCTFVIGPCESAVRIGTTTNSRFIVSCQQFRTRDCKDLDVMIHIHAGQPIIESSTKIRFGAFDYNYFGLEGHFGEAGMEPWNSEWSNIHDFNDTKGSSNWSYLPSSTRWSDLVASINESDGSLEEMPGYVVPRTYGGRSLPGLPGDSAKRCFVAVYAPHHEQGYTLLDKLATELSEEKELFLIRTRVNKPGFTKNESKEFFTNHPGQIDLSFAGPMIGMEFAGTDDMYAVIKQAAAELPSVFVSPANEAGAMLAKYFETIKAF